VYFVILKLDEDKEIEIGKLGRIEFKKGYYVYVGSAKRGFNKRVRRHFKRKKKLRWHIDYFSSHAEAIEAYRAKIDECKVAELASHFMEGIKKFGASDCKCKTHLFYSTDYPTAFIEEAKKLNYITAERLNYEEL